MSQLCYWCRETVIVCPKCLSEFGKMETCSSCETTGFLCPTDHGASWQGHVPCSPENEAAVDAWVRSVCRDPWDHEITESLPFAGEETLSYLAFMADFNAYRRFPRTSEDLRAKVQLTRARDLAVRLGGREPNVLRAGPLGACAPEAAVSAPPEPPVMIPRKKWWQR
jgi:hypothetical protein